MEDENQTILNEIALKMRENIEPIFIESLLGSSSQLDDLEGIQELTSWYQKIEKNKDDYRILEKILENTANEIMKYLPQEYASTCIENIKINSKDKKQNVKFDMSFQLESIKPYVEFAVNVNKIRKKTGRVIFEINSSVTIKDIEITLEREKQSKISLGLVLGTIQISIVEVPFMKINEPIEIGTKDIEIDLSEYQISK